MKKTLFFLFLWLSFSLQSQNFVLLTDSDNPIVSTPPSSQSNNPTFAYTGASWIDVNQDNFIDLFYSGHLFINEGAGQFRKADGVPNTGPTALTSCSWADFDQDGDYDLLYAHPSAGTQVFANDGSGSFALFPSVLDSINSATWSAQWSDFNNDGYADIILTFADGFLGASHFPCRLFTGSSSGTFSPYQDSTVAFLNELHPYTISNWIDYDQDGDQDLFIASGPGGVGAALDFLYHNQLIETGNATFSRITEPTFARQAQDGQCYNFIDFDNDGDLDLCLTNWASGTLNRFYRNDDGTYILQVTPFSSGTNTNSLSNAWGDLDNDGYLDVIIASNGTIGNYYHNDADGTFSDRGNIIHGPVGGTTSGLALGDYDNDGDLDFFTTGLEKGLFRNELDNDNHSLNLHLIGNASNKAALGARVKVKVNWDGEQVWLRREVSAQNTFMGHNSLRVHFGLGQASEVDSLVVYWPSGAAEVFTQVAGDKFYEVEEGKGLRLLTTVSVDKPLPVTTFPVQVFPNPAQEQINIVFEQILADEIAISLYNTAGQLVDSSTFTPALNLQFPLRQLPAGEYLLTIRAKSFLKTEKIVID